jgi:tetratricopeptide (TPR) repeat protein
LKLTGLRSNAAAVNAWNRKKPLNSLCYNFQMSTERGFPAVSILLGGQANRTPLQIGEDALAAGDFPAALAAFEQALRHGATDAKTLMIAGNLRLQLGDTVVALAHLEAAATKARHHPVVLGSLAQGYFTVGRFADAEAAFRKAQRADPSQPFAQVGLANALAMQGKLAEAETLLKRVVARFPDHALGWLNLGNVARDLMRAEDAVAHYRRALACDAALVDAHNNLGSVLHALLQFEAAEAEYRACLAAAPDFVQARANLVSALVDQGRFAEAEAEGRALIAQAPDFREGHAYLASAIAMQGRLREALPVFERAAHGSSSQDAGMRARLSYAAALSECGDIEASLRVFGPITHAPGELALPLAQMLAPVLLAHGFFAEGWRALCSRHTYHRVLRHYGWLQPRQSLPRDMQGVHVGVVGEQGLGDELFFLRFVPRLKQLGARVTYCANAKFGGMLARMGVLDDVVFAPEALPVTDVNILVADVPHALCERERDGADEPCVLWDFPWQSAPYAPLPEPGVAITPLPQALDQARALLAAAGPPPYLALTWRGGTAPDKQRGGEWKLYKEIPIPALAAALAPWPGTFITVQRLPADGELSAISQALGKSVADFTAFNDDLEIMLALMALVDDYVGVSNTNMHLRAAAGRVARVLLPCPAEWRWMALGTQSPWFPGFVTYRQDADGRWTSALDALRRDIKII